MSLEQGATGAKRVLCRVAATDAVFSVQRQRCMRGSLPSRHTWKAMTPLDLKTSGSGVAAVNVIVLFVTAV